ncbi:hypothetical protein HPB48_019595 [Haemaphysalis longicornis]|uniref:Uncharacterized protein n=1 Tax=Haemaphysalis longicornis TaxID=44386 RepID=A0A9J6FF26_HAELO|nr:hypothetical protein HPB48_019595 [Haemaphysalis longicornis]
MAQGLRATEIARLLNPALTLCVGELSHSRSGPDAAEAIVVGLMTSFSISDFVSDSNKAYPLKAAVLTFLLAAFRLFAHVRLRPRARQLRTLAARDQGVNSYCAGLFCDVREYKGRRGRGLRRMHTHHRSTKTTASGPQRQFGTVEATLWLRRVPSSCPRHASRQRCSGEAKRGRGGVLSPSSENKKAPPARTRSRSTGSFVDVGQSPVLPTGRRQAVLVLSPPACQRPPGKACTIIAYIAHCSPQRSLNGPVIGSGQRRERGGERNLRASFLRIAGGAKSATPHVPLQLLLQKAPGPRLLPRHPVGHFRRPQW